MNTYEEVKDLLAAPLDGESERDYAIRMSAAHSDIDDINSFARIHYCETKYPR